MRSTLHHAKAGASPTPSQRIPSWLKLAYTGFMAVLIPVYWSNYGPTNFLYFCDVALLLTLVGIWTGNRLLISMSAVGILVPQALWVIDFAAQLTGHKLTGMTTVFIVASYIAAYKCRRCAIAAASVHSSR
ncbi:MAG: hypothetical protein ACYDH9_22310, partial [Limisphaerales bacterium]